MARAKPKEPKKNKKTNFHKDITAKELNCSVKWK